MAATAQTTTATSEQKETGPAVGQPGYQITRDPNLIKNRIYVGNFFGTKKQLESICQPYGKVLGAVVLKNYGFVQFESEEIANKVASLINNSTFSGQTMTACNASVKIPVKFKRPPVGAQHQLQMDPLPMGVPTNNIEGNDYNDCEIIVLDRVNTQYAEFVEQRLKRIGLRVDLLFPNAEVPLGKVLSNISSRRCLYAVLVTSQHQELNSVTVNILYGVQSEHRNMPVEDAIALIGNDFRRKMSQDGVVPAPIRPVHANLSGPASHATPYQPLPVIPAIKDHHPENIQVLINLLADNSRLTVLQFNCIIKYLQDLREEQIKLELGSTNEPVRPRTPDPEIELQKRILNILNKPSVAENTYPLMYPTLDAVKQDTGLLNLLKDERVQRAIDSLMDSNLVSTIESYMKF